MRKQKGQESGQVASLGDRRLFQEEPTEQESLSDANEEEHQVEDEDEAVEAQDDEADLDGPTK